MKKQKASAAARKKATCTDPNTVKALKWTYDLCQKEKVVALPGGFEGGADSLFASGKLAVYQAGALAMFTCQYVESDGLAPRDQPQHPLGATPGYKLFECGDGRWIHVGALQADFFQKLLVAMDQAELLLDPLFDQAPNRFKKARLTLYPR